MEQRTHCSRYVKRRFEALVALAQVVWTRRPDGEILVDPSWRAFTGQTVEERAGNGLRLNAIHPGDREEAPAAWKNRPCRILTFTPSNTGCATRLAAGADISAAKAVPLRTETGEVREWVGMNTDITERKEAEQHSCCSWPKSTIAPRSPPAVVQAVARQTAGR